MNGDVCVVNVDGTWGETNRIAVALQRAGCVALPFERAADALETVHRTGLEALTESEPIEPGALEPLLGDPDQPVVLYVHPDAATLDRAVTVSTDDEVATLVDRVATLVDRGTAAAASDDGDGDRERYYQRIVEHSRDGVFVCSLDEIHTVNQAACEQTGYTREELRSMNPFDLVHPDDRERVRKQARRRAKGENSKGLVETRIRRKDGATRHVELSVAATEVDGEYGVIVFQRDVTDRKADERELAVQSERLQTLLTNLPVVVFALDADGRLTLAEGKGLDHLGIAVPEVLGNHIGEADVPALLDGLERAKEGKSHNVSVEFVGRTFDVWMKPLPDETGRTGAIGAAVDITDDRERAARLEQQNERLEEFASIVSHDLRSPLTVASGNIELARMDHESEYLDNALAALDRMDDLIDELLMLARSGRLAGDPERVSLESVARRAWQNVHHADSTLCIETDLTLTADPGRLQELFENLFRNAVEHGSTGPRSHAHEDAVEHGSTGSRSQARGDSVEHGSTEDQQVEANGGGVTIRVTMRDGALCIEDDGPGIPPEKREYVFEPGYTTSDEGTGFGLAIVRQVAEAHGWSVAAGESSEGGACFEIRGLESEQPVDAED
ncbi:PAS domain S-box protein [Natronomonas sp. EA1]|uniref:PAS domain S-box protein n=1 Tax=Natronomonas sp. EA1 TaxID=3421655 RepID=UPI003EBC50D1